MTRVTYNNKIMKKSVSTYFLASKDALNFGFKIDSVHLSVILSKQANKEGTKSFALNLVCCFRLLSCKFSSS